MEADKIYEHNGRKFTVRKSFTVYDIEIRRRCELFMQKVQVKKEELKDVSEFEFVGNKVSADEFVQLMNDILLPIDGEPVPKYFFKDIDELDQIEIFIDFFFVYQKRLMRMNNISISSEKKATAFIEKLNGSKID
jgi:hypothetical protein